jgi:succinate-acetate transporter protein
MLLLLLLFIITGYGYTILLSLSSGLIKCQHVNLFILWYTTTTTTYCIQKNNILSSWQYLVGDIFNTHAFVLSQLFWIQYVVVVVVYHNINKLTCWHLMRPLDKDERQELHDSNARPCIFF